MTEQELIEWIKDPLLLAAIQNKDVAEAVCLIAGILASQDDALRNQLEKDMKRRPRWSKADMIMLWIDYVHYMEKEEDKSKSRARLIEKVEKRTGKKIAPTYLENLLTRAARDIPLEQFPEFVQPQILVRREAGEKKKHRGIQ